MGTFMIETLQDKPIDVSAMVVPALEYVITGDVAVLPPGTSLSLAAGSPAVAAAPTAANMQMLLSVLGAWDKFPNPTVRDAFMQGLPDPAGVLAAAVQIGMASAAGNAVEALEALVAGQAATQPAGGGWTKLAGSSGMYSHPEHGLCHPRDMPVLKFWATMARYFGRVTVEEAMRVQDEVMHPGDTIGAFGARLHALQQAVNAAGRNNPGSAMLTDQVMLEVLYRGLRAHERYQHVLQLQQGSLLALKGVERTVLHVSQKLDYASRMQVEGQVASAQLEARMAGLGLGGGQDSRQQQPRHKPAQGEATQPLLQLQSNSMRHVKAQLANAAPTTLQNLVHAGLQLMGRPEVAAALVRGEQAAADAAVLGAAAAKPVVPARGGLRHPRAEGPVSGGPVRPCRCHRPGRHPAGKPCWVSNPHLAPAHWSIPGPGHPDYAAYVEELALAKGQAVPQFPAALLYAPDVASCVPPQEGWVPFHRPEEMGCGWAQGCLAAAAEAEPPSSSSHGPEEAAAPFAGAAATRAQRVDGEGAAAAGGGGGCSSSSAEYDIDIVVALLAGRDDDMLEELATLARPDQVNSLYEALAAGMFSFGGQSAAQAQQRMAMDWAEGRVTVGVTLKYPRDKGMLKQLQARNALLRCRLREEAGAIPAAAAAQSPLAGVMASMPDFVQEAYARWQRSEGGLVFFANLSRAAGASLVSHDGRVFLLARFLFDCGCQQALMDAVVGRNCGFRLVKVDPVQMRLASGDLITLDSQFEGVTVVLAMGTPYEARCTLNFWCVPGLSPLAEAVFPTVADHQFCSAGVDRFLGVYSYRPFISKGDMEVAKLPVNCRLEKAVPAGAAIAVFLPCIAGAAVECVDGGGDGVGDPSAAGATSSQAPASPAARVGGGGGDGVGDPGAAGTTSSQAPASHAVECVGDPCAGGGDGSDGLTAADVSSSVAPGYTLAEGSAVGAVAAKGGLLHSVSVGALPPGGSVWYKGCLVLAAAEVAQLQAGASVEGVLQLPGSSSTPLRGVSQSWEQCAPWQRLMWAQFDWAAAEVERRGKLWVTWCTLQLPPGGPLNLDGAEMPLPLLLARQPPTLSDGELGPSMVAQLQGVDGYSSLTGVWAAAERAVQCVGADGVTLSYVPSWDTEGQQWLAEWVHMWLALADEGIGGGSSSSAGGWGPSSAADCEAACEVWGDRWLLLHTLWEVAYAPGPVAESAAAALQLQRCLQVAGVPHVQALVDMAAGALQVLQWFAQLQPTGVQEWDEPACCSLVAMRLRYQQAITAWCQWYLAQVEEERRRPVAAPPPSPVRQQPASPPKVAGGVRRARPLLSHLRRLVMLLVCVLLVLGSLQQASAMPRPRVPAHPPLGGSFRPCLW
jgi:hypothetical protein